MIKRIFLLYFFFKETTKCNVNHFIEYFLADKKTTDEFIYHNKPIFPSFLDIMTFGIIRFPLELIFKFIFNNTNFVFNDEELTNYGNLQNQRLFHFFSNINKKIENSSINKTIIDMIHGKEFNNIIRDVAIDYTVYGSKNKIFKKNFYIIENYLSKILFQQWFDITKDENKNSSSSYSSLLKIYLTYYSMNYKTNEFVNFLIDLANPNLDLLTNAGDTKNIAKKFNNENLSRSIEIYYNNIILTNDIAKYQDPDILKQALENKIKEMDNSIEFKEILKFKDDPKKLAKINQFYREFKQNYSCEEQINKYNGLLEQLKNVTSEAQKYKKYYELIQKIRENGLFLPIDSFLENYVPSIHKFISSLMNNINEPIKKYLLDDKNTKTKVSNSNIDSATLFHNKVDEFLKETFPNSENYKKDEEIIEEMKNNRLYKKNKDIRDKLFYEYATIEFLKHAHLFFYAVLGTYLRETLEKLLQKKIEGMTTSVFLSLTNKTIVVINIFPDEIIIDDKNNKQFQQFIHCAIYKILNNKPIPHVIFKVPNIETQKMLQNICKSIFLKKNIIFYVKKIINPIALTKFLTEIKMKDKGVKETNANLGRITHAIFHENIKNFKNLLEMYFIGENYYYLPWISQVIIQSTLMLNSVEKYTLNINKITSKLVTLLEIEAMEYLCATREKNSPYSSCSYPYMELVNDMKKDVMIMIYTTSKTQNLKEEIDPAVLSRIQYQIILNNDDDFFEYLTIIRRCLLELLKIDNLIDLEKNTFEEALWMLCRFFYNNNYDTELIDSTLMKFKKQSIKQPLKINDIINKIQNQDSEEGI